MTDLRTRTKVAYLVAPSRHFAGIERVVHEIASGLAELHSQMFDVHVIFSSSYDEALLEKVPYTKHVLGIAQLRHMGAALRRCVAEERFDVLVTPQVEASAIAWVSTRGLGLRVLLPHLHGNPRLEEAEGTLRTKAAFTLFRNVVSRNVPAVLAVSPSLRDYAAKNLAPHTKVTFVRNPARELATPGWQPAPDDRYRFISVARLSRQKGQDVLLRALAQARSSLPPVVLTLVGEGPGQAELRRLSTELELDDIVVFAGYAADPAKHLSTADCFVLASRWEGFGVAIVEALQSGLPVLATDCDFGPADIVVDPSMGELVAADDVGALAEGLKRAVGWQRDPADVERRRKAASAYSRDAATATHFSVLRAVEPTVVQQPR